MLQLTNENNKSIIAQLPGEPLVWNIFAALCETPHPSHYCDKIVPKLMELAAHFGFEATHDADGNNVVIVKKADPGYENKPTVVLQGHSDMVAEKLPELVHDFKNDAIKLRIDGEWLKATNTTLGADDGVATAFALAYMATQKSGRIELLITSNEEVGLLGANALKKGFVTGKYLINIDSEEANEIAVGCAGSLSFYLTRDIKTEAKKQSAHHVAVTGGFGGHSGADIHCFRFNSLVGIGALLDAARSADPEARLANIVAGKLRNAIPRDGSFDIVCNDAAVEAMKKTFNEIKEIYAVTDPSLKIEVTKTEVDGVYDAESSDAITDLLLIWPNGLWRINDQGATESSNNLASIAIADGVATVTVSARSFIDDALTHFYARSARMAARCGFKISEYWGNYSGWKPNYNSQLLAIAKDSFKQSFGTEPRVYAIHAGLECSILMAKDPVMEEAISIGPTIVHAHSPDEACHIKECVATYEAFVTLMENFYKNF